MLNMQNGAIGAWRPSFWAREARGPVRARARARARARYLKKRAASFLTRESLEQKCGNLWLMCAQWTNLGGVIFHFLKNVCKIFGESGARTLRAGWTQAVRKPCASRAQAVRKPCANRAQTVRKYPRLPPRRPLAQKCIFGRKISGCPIDPLDSFGRPRLQNGRKRRFLRQRVGILREFYWDSTGILLRFYLDSPGFY